MRFDLEAIYRGHRRGFFALALAYTGSPQQAEDVVHDVFAKLCTKVWRPRGNQVSYVYVAIRNAAIDAVRQQGRQRTATSEVASLFDPDALTPSQAADRAEQLASLEEAIDSLTNEQQRETLVLRICSGLPFWQIAEILGEPLATVTSRYRRTIQKLQQKVGSV